LRAVVVLLLLVGARPAVGQRDTECRRVEKGFGPDGRVPIRAETVVSGLEVPWSIAFLPGGDVLVTERPGRLRLVRDGALVREPVAVIEAVDEGEGGLLGLTLHPRFAENRQLYIYYTAAGRAGSVNRVERWSLSKDGRTATRERTIVDGIPAARFHSGGRLRFGPDGMLYIGTGDARRPDRSQDRDSRAGKILRVTPDGGVPDDNPWPGNPAFVMGVRNTEGFDWDAGGRLYVTDHGPSGELGRSGNDEVSLAASGANLGWPAVFGCRSDPRFQAPLLSWAQAAPPGGATVYQGGAIPEWKGDLLIATLGSRHLQRVRLTSGPSPGVESHEVYLRGDPPEGLGRLRDVVTGPDGALYVTTSNCDGRGRCPADGDKIVRITR
jgi:aldose sugar dehydrogenase